MTDHPVPAPHDEPSDLQPSDAVDPSRPADPSEPAKPTEPERPPAGFTSRGKVKRTRAGGAWVGLVAAAVLVIVLLVFIAQNSDKVSITFLGFDGRISLAIALLLSAAIGVLVVAIPGGIRIAQLRRDLKKNAKRH